MFDAKTIENLFDSTFKTNEFYKNMGTLQSLFIGNYQAVKKASEENQKVTKEYFKSQAQLFNPALLMQKIEEVRVLNEQSYAKVKSYFEQNSKLFNNDAFLAQLKQLSKTVEEGNLKALNYLQNNATLVNSEALWDQLGKNTKIIEENQKKAISYFNEQYNFFKSLQDELFANMQNAEGIKNVPESIKKYSKAVANLNIKKIDESLDVVKKAVA